MIVERGHTINTDNIALDWVSRRTFTAPQTQNTWTTQKLHKNITMTRYLVGGDVDDEFGTHGGRSQCETVIQCYFVIQQQQLSRLSFLHRSQSSVERSQTKHFVSHLTKVRMMCGDDG